MCADEVEVVAPVGFCKITWYCEILLLYLQQILSTKHYSADLFCIVFVV